MSEVAVAPGPPAEESGRSRIVRIAIWIGGLLALFVVLQLVGVDIRGWLADLWDAVNDISLAYIVIGCVFQGLQTALVAYAWYRILRYAYSESGITYLPILASYAVGVALNNVVPANLGTFVTLLMYVAVVHGSTFPGVFAGYLVHKIFYTVVGGLVYLYLFLEVAGSFDFAFGNERDTASNHPLLVLGIIAGTGLLVVMLVRVFWRFVKKLWAQAKEGGAILGNPRAYATQVLLPQCGGYLAKIGVICVFLAAYKIPVTFGSVMSVIGSSSLANVLSFTPGGVGVNQAFNAFALEAYTDSTTATAYSVSQQLVTTAFNMGFAILLVAVVFGWSGGSQLVRGSYDEAKVKASEMRASRGQKGDAEPDEA